MSCSKEKFDKKSAKTVLNHCKKEHRKECRIYECPECKCWHLTSEPEYEERIYLKSEELIFADKWKNLLGN